MNTILQEKEKFTAALQLGSHIYSSASSHENSCSKCSSGQGMGKIGEHFGGGTWQKSQKFILPHWWTSFIGRMPNWRQSTKNTKVELYSEAILWKMILDLMQYSLNKVHQHQKWQQQKVMDIISRLPGCARQAADAVSAYTQVKMEDAPQSLKIPKSEMSRHLDLSTTTHMTKINVQYGRPSRSSWAKSVWSSIGRTVMGKAIWENLIEIRLGEGFQLGMLIRTKWKRVILICVCGWHKIGWKETKYWSDVETTQERSRFWRTNIFLGSCILGLHSTTMRNKQRYCGQLQNHVWIQNFRRRNWKITIPSENLRISSWSNDMAGHAKKCVERYCELANKTTQQLSKVSTPCIDDHHFKEEEMKSVGVLSQVCSQIVLKCLYLARIERPDILWSVNNLARSITKWTKACDKRLNRLISYIHHTCEYKQYCYVGNTAKQCRHGLFRDSDFAGDLEDSKSTSGGTLCVFGSHTFVPISWMCKKQTSISHS